MQLEWQWWGPFAISVRHGSATGNYDWSGVSTYLGFISAESVCLNMRAHVFYAMRTASSAREVCGTTGAGALPAASASSRSVR